MSGIRSDFWVDVAFKAILVLLALVWIQMAPAEKAASVAPVSVKQEVIR